jgi:hypothetical protein
MGDWPFDGNAVDMSGNGNHGVVNGAILARDRFDRPNMAYRFNGTTSEIDVPDAASIDATNNNSFSFCFWEKTYAGNTSRAIIAKHVGGTWNGYSFIANNQSDPGYCTGADHMYFYTAAGAQEDACSNSGILADTLWRFIVGVYNSTPTTAVLYINAIAQTDVGQRNPYGNLSNPANLNFGYEAASSSTSHYNGVLDGARMYNRALTQQEIDNLYNECVPSVPVNVTTAQARIICKNNSTVLRATSNGTVNWYTSTSSVSVGTGTAFTTGALTPGIYTFLAAASSSCSQSTKTAITVTVAECASLADLTLTFGKLEIFPNPGSGFVSVKTMFPSPATVLIVRDATGREIERHLLDRELTSVALPKGLFVLSVEFDGKPAGAGTKVIVE